MFGTQYLTTNADEQAVLDRSSYEAGQQGVVSAKDTQDRAAGYQKMRQAWNKPGSGRLLADPSRDPARLLSQDYQRLASASPLPQKAKGKGRGPVQLADVRAREKINRPIISDLNSAMLLRSGIASNPLLQNLDPGNLLDGQAQALVDASGGQLRLWTDSGKKTNNLTVTVNPTAEEAEAIKLAIAEDRPSDANQIRQGLNVRALSIIGMLDNENLDQAATDVGEYSNILDKWRILSASGSDPKEQDRIEALMIELSGPISQANGNLRAYLGQSEGRAAAAANAANAAKGAAENAQAGAGRERLGDLTAIEGTRPLTSGEANERINLETVIKKAGGTVPVSSSDGAPSELGPSTPLTEQQKFDAAAGKPLSGEMSMPDEQMTTHPSLTDRGVAETRTAGNLESKAAYLRKKNVPEEIIAKFLPGYEAARDFKKKPLTSGERHPLMRQGKEHSVAKQKDIIRRDAARKRTATRALERKETIGPMESREAYALDKKRSTQGDLKAFLDRRDNEPSAPRTSGPVAIKAKSLTRAQVKAMATMKRRGKDGKIDDSLDIRPTEDRVNVLMEDMARGELYKPNPVPKGEGGKKDVVKLKAMAAKAAAKHKVPEALFLALINKESRFRPSSVSSSNAIGIAQMLPGTFRDMNGKNAKASDLFKPDVALDASAKYIAYLIKTFKGSKDGMKKAIAAYNAGEGNVRRRGLYGSRQVKHPTKKGKFITLYGVLEPGFASGQTRDYLFDKKFGIYNAHTAALKVAAKATPKAPKKGS